MSAQYKSLLYWVGETVTAINTLQDDPGQCEVEVIAWIDDEHRTEAFKGHGPTILDAFIRALNSARDFEAKLKARSVSKCKH